MTAVNQGVSAAALHGFDGTYQWHRCRCAACREAHRQAQARWRQSKRTPIVAPEPPSVPAPNTRTLYGPSVPVGPLRDAFERSDMTATEVAMRVDWRNSRGYPDCSRVKRALGLQTYGDGLRGAGNVRQRLHQPTALALGRALGLDPHEVGL